MSVKVGIITFHNVNNYGSVLQTYATQETFRRLGCETEVIDYSRDDQRSYWYKLKDACQRSSFSGNFFSRAAYYAIKAPSYLRQKQVFEEFLKQYVAVGAKQYSSYEQLQADPPKVDVVCTGSDQMWNSEYNKGIEKAYFLAFEDDSVAKIAYSTSVGIAHFPRQEAGQIAAYLRHYKAISVREASAVDALKEIGIEGAVQVLDPTMVLTAEEWRKLASSKYANHKPYVLIYQLNPNAEFDRFAEEMAKDNGCDLLRINLLYDQMSKCGTAVNIPTVSEYISLLANARCVVTDSFHGTAFCINLNTPFYVFYPPKYSSRLESILGLTGLEDRVVQGGNFAPEQIRFELANEIIEGERKKNIAFLKKALEV